MKKNNDMEITEDYCDFETAKLLAKKGFDIITEKCYILDNSSLCAVTVGQIFNGRPQGKHEIPAPTLQMALKWLREKCKLIIEIDYNNDIECDENERWGFSWYLRPHYEVNLNTYATNEEATEAAIKYCLTNLID